MTYEEAAKLKPGRKVVFSYPLNEEWALDILKAQEENGGFLVIKEVYYFCEAPVFLSLASEEFFGGINVSLFKLYEDPNQPWSYERDY